MYPMRNRVSALLTAAFLMALLLVLCCPVGAAEEAQRKDILEIRVQTGTEEGGIPLPNVILDIYAAGSKPEGTASAADKESIAQRCNLLATLITDVNGRTQLDVREITETVLITVQDNPAVLGKNAALLVSPNGKTQPVIMELLPEKATGLQMDISTLQQKSGTFDIGQPHTWIIRCDIPAGICNGKEFVVTDSFDHRLDYAPGSVRLSLQNRSGEEIPLENSHYLLTEGTQTRNGLPVDVFQLSLTPEGMTYIAANLGAGNESAQLLARFQAAINRNAAMGAAIPNDAHLLYTSSVGVTYYADSDIPEVHTGGIRILKTDDTGTPISGCGFMLAREATQAELEDESILKEVLHIGSRNLAVVYVDFYADMSAGEKTFTVTSDREGRASAYGLACGTYYLVESGTPEGYDGAAQPMEIEISQSSHLPENTVQVVNRKFLYPQTGGMGTTAFTVAGCLLLCAACLLLLSNRGRKH